MNLYIPLENHTTLSLTLHKLLDNPLWGSNKFVEITQ